MPPAHLGLGWHYLDRFDFDRVIGELEKTIELDPENSTAYAYLGTCYFEKKQEDKAFELFGKAKEIDDKDAHVYVWLANICSKRGDIPKSLENLRKCLSLDPAFKNFIKGTKWFSNLRDNQEFVELLKSQPAPSSDTKN